MSFSDVLDLRGFSRWGVSDARLQNSILAARRVVEAQNAAAELSSRLRCGRSAGLGSCKCGRRAKRLTAAEMVFVVRRLGPTPGSQQTCQQATRAISRSRATENPFTRRHAEHSRMVVDQQCMTAIYYGLTKNEVCHETETRIANRRLDDCPSCADLLKSSR